MSCDQNSIFNSNLCESNSTNYLREYELGEVIEIFDRMRVPLSATQREKRKGKYPYYGAQGIIDYIDDFIFNGEYLLIAEDGENIRSRKAPIANLAKGKFWVNNHAHIIKNNEKSNLKYIGYILNRLDISGFMTGSTQPKLSQQNLINIRLALPTVEIQNSIASILSSLDDKIELNNRMNKTLEEMAQAIFKRWFVDFEFPDENGNPYKSSEGKMVESELGLIPEGWGVGTLADIITVKYGKDHKKLPDGKIPVFGSGGIMRHADSALYTSESVLIPRKGSLNNVTYVNEPFWSVDTMFYTIMKKANIAKFVYFALLSKDLALMNAGSAVPSMTTEILNAIPVVIPSSKMLEHFEGVIGVQFKKVENNKKENDILAKHRDTHLPRLMSGEIRIDI